MFSRSFSQPFAQRIVMAIMAIGIAVLTGWQPVAAGQRIPLLHWYNGASGTTAVGYIGGNDRFVQQPDPGAFFPGWTHAVHLPDYYMLVYNANTGAGATVWLNNAGQYITVASYEAGAFTTGWSSIVNVGGNRLLFYRAADGLAALGTVDRNGYFTTVRSYENYFAAGWTQIVHTGATGTFFYNGVTGTGEVGSLNQAGDYRPKQLHQNLFSTGWTHIAYHFSNGQLVYYNRHSGALAVGRLDNAGNHTTLTSYQHKSGLTAVVPMHGKLLFYNGANGAADLMRIGVDGAVTYKSWKAGTYSTGWTTIVYGY
jgi:hypothetical protein